MIDVLFAEAFKRASDNNDLWWQIRALQELGWDTELKTLLIKSEAEIEESGNVLLLKELARVKEYSARILELNK